MSKPERQKWDGGHVHVQKDGQPLFIIEKRIGGRRFHISTRATTATAAYEQLKQFQADPWAYAKRMKEGPEDTEALHLTKERVLEFRDWMLTRDRPATSKHANELAHRLFDWMEDIGTRDLRRLSLPHLKRAVLDRKTSRQHRIIALKAFMSWMRDEKHEIDRRDDVTLDLKVPQADPEKHRRRKAVEFRRVEKVLPFLADGVRDLLWVAAATGWHFTEIERFARRPDSEIVYPKRRRKRGTLANLVTWHKTKKWTKTPINSPEALAAAERLRDRGEIPRRANKALRDACERAKVEPFTFGVCRHSVATWLAERGASDAQVATHLDHDPKTSRKFYIDLRFVEAAIPPPRLRLKR